MPGINPSNRRLRRSNNLTNYGAASGGFGFGIPGGVGTSYHGFRLFNRVKKECCKIPKPVITEIWKLFQTLTIAAGGTEFGKSVAISQNGNFIAVIAQDTLYPNLPANNQRKGSVHIFKLRANATGYDEVDTHAPSADQMRIGDNGFSSEISISDDGHTIIYSETNINTTTGSGIVLKKNANDDLFQVLHKLEGTNGDGGAEVAISGNADRVAVASFASKDIQLFKLNGGNGQYAKEGGTISNANADISTFGRSIAFNTDGTTLVVGTNNGYYILGNTGVGGAWAVINDFIGNAGTLHQAFGNRVDIAGDASIVIASHSGEDNGNIVVYKKDPNNLPQYIIDTTIKTDLDNEISSIAISKDGSKIIIGNSSYDTPANNNGVVVVYKKDGADWVIDDKKLPGAPGDQFGRDVDISADGSIIIAGCPDAPNLADNGYVRIYKFN